MLMTLYWTVIYMLQFEKFLGSLLLWEVYTTDRANSNSLNMSMFIINKVIDCLIHNGHEDVEK